MGKSQGGWTSKLHMGAADTRTAITVSLSPGQAHDAPVSSPVPEEDGRMERSVDQQPALVMVRTFEDDDSR